MQVLKNTCIFYVNINGLKTMKGAASVYFTSYRIGCYKKFLIRKMITGSDNIE